MLGDLLQTKLYLPRLRPSLVPRPHLIDKLNQGLHRKLTLISAPAGFGKTTLVSEWIAECERPFAWLTLDGNDSHLPRFLAYLIATLQTLNPSFGKKSLRMLESPQPVPIDAILTTLVNEIAASLQAFSLVLDDYHVLDAPAVDEALAFLLAHLPPQMHLVITSREDPLLPLHRLRARGLLTELRAADLRFKGKETAAFLHKVSGLQLSTETILALERRTEGWVAGLQLAALSMQGRADGDGFIEAFAGDDRYIVDYLVNEVLHSQPQSIQSFLLQTSILSRLSGALCDAVTDQKESSNVLNKLERSNLFVVPLDDKRQWYRYHHLFADVLQAYLLKDHPDQIPILHQRASEWYEHHHLMADAVHHAFAAKDLARAAKLIESTWAEMDRNRQSSEWLSWAKKLPDELIRNRPVLSVGYAWALLDSGQLEGVRGRLRDAEQQLAAPFNMVVADEEEFHLLEGTIASARTYHALALGDLTHTIDYAQQALAFFPQEEHLRRGTPAALLGLAFWASDDLAAAIDSFTEAMTHYQLAGNSLFVITGAYVLADMKLAQGQLRAALKLLHESLQLAEEQGEPALRGSADLYTGLSELFLEQNDLKTAEEYLLKSKKRGEEAALPRWRYRWCLAQAKMAYAAGNLDDALKALDAAEQHYVRGPVPDIRSISAMKARVWVAQGKLSQARQWSVAQNLSVDDNLSYQREFDHITLARILIAQSKHGPEESLKEAVLLLERLRQAAMAGGRAGSLIEILGQLAIAYQAQGNTSQAISALNHALTLAEPEGYIRTFVAEGEPMAALLKRVKDTSGEIRRYILNLLAAFDGRKGVSLLPTNSQPLIEPLSERELEVLQLVADGLTNREIAQRLYLALPTVKGHNRNIYSKLQVSRRTEAVARARDLGLVGVKR